MKQFLTMVVMMALTMPVFGQNQQTLLQGDIDHGGYGGPVLKAVQIDGSTEMMVGGRGGWIINHTFVLGGGGYGLASNHPAGEDSLLELGYGGLYCMVILQSDEMIHVTAGSMFGAGGIDRRPDLEDWEDYDHNNNDGNPFWVIEPEVNLELNVTNFFRIGAGVSYRYVKAMDGFDTMGIELSGYAANLEFKFGGF
ncbi:MAG: hypothetical protein K9N46_16675 [Candidatus Marinimicrobia bacterium]|nr:hypothetical protein [Candidatus Neomarinimicrobiota bacterium]MCF7830062.1 hypothetical protein [Candidatus Neomarinimicrobiota bacterium]MCF7882363.1 hypothetical protein [Candidatus Neomarinimicrobiota bacterium]